MYGYVKNFINKFFDRYNRAGFDPELFGLAKPLGEIEAWVAKNAIVNHCNCQIEYGDRRVAVLEYNKYSQRMCLYISGIQLGVQPDLGANFWYASDIWYYVGSQVSFDHSVNYCCALESLVAHWPEVKARILEINERFAETRDRIGGVVGKFEV